MIFGSLSIDGGVIHTHRDSYLIKGLSVISVRRPFLPTGLLIAASIGGFGLAYGDLLHPGERIIIALIALAALGGGWTLGQLQLLSRDLRGSELSGAIYGSYGHLNRLRRQIVAAKHGDRPEGAA
ncbi:hypothetical protein FJU08_00700 [Martelella alba]|uniref:Uncharacterized protein n=1 Tax=Martelella alba TaxID=2590451 RepID=A0A506UIG2_9HYPH|nr:hypothetical protein [Martelella alba]TPW33121.1 hypothetical protein FJU08_00700 [Martelella alba]